MSSGTGKITEDSPVYVRTLKIDDTLYFALEIKSILASPGSKFFTAAILRKTSKNFTDHQAGGTCPTGQAPPTGRPEDGSKISVYPIIIDFNISANHSARSTIKTK